MKYFFLKFVLLSAFLAGNSEMSAQMPPTNEWNFVDQSSGQVFPWYTKPFLDELATWDISNWDVFEWGAGYSTLWYASHCRNVVSVDSSLKWVNALQEELDQNQISNVILKYRPGSEENFPMSGGGEDSLFVNSIDENDALYDCIIIDGFGHRNTCAMHVLKHLKENGILILDNANQASIGLNSAPTFELLKEYEHFSYLQPGHPDWRTDFWIIRKVN